MPLDWRSETRHRQLRLVESDRDEPMQARQRACVSQTTDIRRLREAPADTRANRNAIGEAAPQRRRQARCSKLQERTVRRSPRAAGRRHDRRRIRTSCNARAAQRSASPAESLRAQVESNASEHRSHKHEPASPAASAGPARSAATRRAARARGSRARPQACGVRVSLAARL